jgi:ABC-type transport system involved in multi-copper enzyme maturation, permease component
MRGLLTIVQLTVHEAARRRILLAALLGGAAFLALYGTGFYFVGREMQREAAESLLQRRMALNLLVLAGLFAVNFLSIMTAVLLPADTLSGEIASGVMQTVAAKPVRRSTIVLGKWAAFSLLVVGYLLLLAGGVLAVGRGLGHFTPPAAGVGALPDGARVRAAGHGRDRLRHPLRHDHERRGRAGAARARLHRQLGGADRHPARQRRGAGGGHHRQPDHAERVAVAAGRLAHAAGHHARAAHEPVLAGVGPPAPAMVAWALGYLVVALLLGLRTFRRRAL